MAVKRVASNVDIVTAARQRIKNVFSNGVPVYMSFSGGKDSLCLADLTLKLIQAGEIDPAQLTVLFIDEEAIFDCIEETTKAWRKKFLLAGAKFQWWCIEVKHFNCLNELSSDETFVCWDRRKRDVWVRQAAALCHPQPSSAQAQGGQLSILPAPRHPGRHYDDRRPGGRIRPAPPVHGGSGRGR